MFHRLIKKLLSMAKGITKADTPAQHVQDLYDGIMDDHKKFHEMAADSKNPNDRKIYTQCTAVTLSALNGLQKIIDQTK